MNDQATLVESPRTTEAPESLARLRHAIEHAAHVLPAQGPITVFIHHNTLHAFEDSTFEEAVKRGADTFSAHPYLPEEQYREALSRGRIRFVELRSVLEADLGDDVAAPI